MNHDNRRTIALVIDDHTAETKVDHHWLSKRFITPLKSSTSPK
jgi:uncharacterized protein YtpQ (UPF0354 family)